MLPPGECNGIVAQPLPVYSRTSDCFNRLRVLLLPNKHGYKQTLQQRYEQSYQYRRSKTILNRLSPGRVTVSGYL